MAEPHVALYCPETHILIASEKTTPERVDRAPSGSQVSWYDCPACDDEHGFLWGPPAPVLVEKNHHLSEEYRASLTSDSS